MRIGARGATGVMMRCNIGCGAGAGVETGAIGFGAVTGATTIGTGRCMAIGGGSTGYVTDVGNVGVIGHVTGLHVSGTPAVNAAPELKLSPAVDCMEQS